MKDFWIRLVSAAAVVTVLLGYNGVLEARAREDEIAQLNARLETAKMAGALTEEEAGETAYRDGTYTGEADGFGGTIKVEIVIADGTIQDIRILSAEKEDGAYLATAEAVIPVILAEQTADVDTISGATFSSTGIRDAAAQALKDASQ